MSARAAVLCGAGCTTGLALLLALLVSVAPAAGKPPPRSFFGVVPQTSLSAQDLDRMEGVVGTLRIAVFWFAVEPTRGAYDFEGLDAAIGSAAERGIRVLPFVYGTPPWISADQARPPLAEPEDQRAWSSFLRRLVDRYGPGGDFWAARERRLPVRRWQIWNEPNFRLYWHPRPAPRQYARLLAISARAIRGRDANAQIALAGVAPVGAGFLPWVYLRRLYRVPGVKRNFDLVAVHPYATTVGRMAEQVRAARYVMDAAGDPATPLLVTEFGVASVGMQPSAFIRGERGQATFLQNALRFLLSKRRDWRIAGADWFTWQDLAQVDPSCAFCEGAGLFDVGGEPKPAWWVFKRSVSTATRRALDG